MSLVFRTDQSTPLTNAQVDGNFTYLRDQIALKYDNADVSAATISLKLRTVGVGQTSLQLAEANAINAFTLRDLAPSYILPIATDKSSVIIRDSGGNFAANVITAALNGNAATATLAATTTAFATARQINGVSFDATANITIIDSTKLSLVGGTMTGKLNVLASAANSASINFGTSTIAPTTPSNGDLWATTSGLFSRISGVTDQFAMLTSPLFVGTPRTPGYSGEASQIAALSHLDNATTTLNTAIALKAPISSPVFTGDPKAPTPAVGDNDTSIATTAFVKTTTDNKASDLTSSYQTYTTNAITTQSNATNILLQLKAQLDSPQFTGVPSAPTAALGTNSGQLATTAFTTSAIATLQSTINSAISALNTSIVSTRPVPVGAVFYTTIATAPTGYLEANGTAVSRITYIDLFQALGSPNTGNGSSTFNLPDLRGEFIRGWDHGRSIDVDRVLLSSQTDDFKSHHHSYSIYSNSWRVAGGDSTSPLMSPTPRDTTDIGGSETRPRNIALMPIIKW